MSGVMNFTTNSSMQTMGSGHGQNGGGVRNSSTYGIGERSRGSLSFSDANMSSSFYQENEDGTEGNETIKDTDVWGTRIILSGIENIAFSESPSPTLSSCLIEAFQKYLLAVNSTVSNKNPFVEFSKTESSEDKFANDISRNNSSTKNQLGGFGDILENLRTTTFDKKVVIRSVISAYIRNLASNIIETCKIFTDLNAILPVTKNEKTKTQDKKLIDMLAMVPIPIQALQKQSIEYDTQTRALLRQRDEELKKMERDTLKFKESTVELVKENAKQEDPKFVSSYLDFLETEKNCLLEQIRLEKLQIEIEENPIELQQETEKYSTELKRMLDTMLVEVDEMEHKIEQYNALGNSYSKFLQQYNIVEEEIKTKEWVKEQLQNYSKDDSILSDSFC